MADLRAVAIQTVVAVLIRQAIDALVQRLAAPLARTGGGRAGLTSADDAAGIGAVAGEPVVAGGGTRAGDERAAGGVDGNAERRAGTGVQAVRDPVDVLIAAVDGEIVAPEVVRVVGQEQVAAPRGDALLLRSRRQAPLGDERPVGPHGAEKVGAVEECVQDLVGAVVVEPGDVRESYDGCEYTLVADGGGGLARADGEAEAVDLPVRLQSGVELPPFGIGGFRHELERLEPEVVGPLEPGGQIEGARHLARDDVELPDGVRLL